MTIDLSPWRDPGEIIDAIWQVRRAGRTDLRPAVIELLDHEDPQVREEAMSLLFVKWSDISIRDRLIAAIESDPDFGVRARAIGMLALLTDADSKALVRQVLPRVIYNLDEDSFVRKVAYEELHEAIRGKAITLDDDVDIDKDVDLSWITPNGMTR